MFGALASTFLYHNARGQVDNLNLDLTNSCGAQIQHRQQQTLVTMTCGGAFGALDTFVHNAQVPATYQVELVSEDGELAWTGRRRLLDTEKLVFSTDELGRPMVSPPADALSPQQHLETQAASKALQLEAVRQHKWRTIVLQKDGSVDLHDSY